MIPQLRGGHKRNRLGVGELAGKAILLRAILLRAILPRFSVGQSPQWTPPLELHLSGSFNDAY